MPFYRSSPNKQTLNDSDEQLSLPLAIQDAPHEVREHGLQEIHSFPLVSRGKGCAVFRKPARMAWRRYQEIELRTPNSFPALIFDVDTLPLDYLSIAFGVTVCPPTGLCRIPKPGTRISCTASPARSCTATGCARSPQVAAAHRRVLPHGVWGGSRLRRRPDAQPGASQMGNDMVA